MFLTLVLLAASAAAQPVPTPPTARLARVETLQHKARKPLLRRWYVRLAVGAGAFAVTSYALRGRAANGPRPIVITPGRTTIAWQTCPDATCGGALGVRP